jgi:hypothetical protein
VLAIVAVGLAIDLWRHRDKDDIARLLATCTFVPLAILVVLCLVHRTAEPHWIAPALLPLPLWAARRAADSDRPRLLGLRWIASGAAIAALMVAFVHVWTLWSQAPKLAPASYDPKVDITNELYGWNDAIHGIEAQSPNEEDTAIVGPHWVICAQVHAALPFARVGCLGESDFEDWFPKKTWEHADRIIYVSDARFPEDFGAERRSPSSASAIPTENTVPTETFAEYNIGAVQHVTSLRGGRVVRTFTITLLERRARAEL